MQYIYLELTSKLNQAISYKSKNKPIQVTRYVGIIGNNFTRILEFEHTPIKYFFKHFSWREENTFSDFFVPIIADF